jgi:hypothetical protein
MRVPVLLVALSLLAACASNVRTARKLLEQGEREEARRVLEREIVAHPNNGQALLMRGLIAMLEEDFETAHSCFDRAKARSLDYRREVEARYEPMLNYLESIVWVQIRPTPSLFDIPILRLPSPIEAYRILETEPGWTRFSLKSWNPNNEAIAHYRETGDVKVLFDSPEMVYIELTGWAPSEHIRQRNRTPLSQNVNLQVERLESVNTKDGRILVFGEVTNRGRATADNVRAVITALSLEFDNFGFSPAVGDPMGAPPPQLLQYWMQNMVQASEETVPVSPDRLAPGETGIIVVYVKPRSKGTRMFFEAEMIGGRDRR